MCWRLKIWSCAKDFDELLCIFGMLKAFVNANILFSATEWVKGKQMEEVLTIKNTWVSVYFMYIYFLLIFSVIGAYSWYMFLQRNCETPFTSTCETSLQYACRRCHQGSSQRLWSQTWQISCFNYQQTFCWGLKTQNMPLNTFFFTFISSVIRSWSFSYDTRFTCLLMSFSETCKSNLYNWILASFLSGVYIFSS